MMLLTYMHSALTRHAIVRMLRRIDATVSHRKPEPVFCMILKHASHESSGLSLRCLALKLEIARQQLLQRNPREVFPVRPVKPLSPYISMPTPADTLIIRPGQLGIVWPMINLHLAETF